MKYIRKFNLFEGESPKGKVSEELQNRYPKLASSIKKEFIYFFNRGLFGYFDVLDKPNGTTILTYVPQKPGIPAIEFNAFVITDYLTDLKSLKPSTNPNWKKEDMKSIDSFSNALGINSWSKNYEDSVASGMSTVPISRDFFRWFGQSPQYEYFKEYLKLILPNTKYTVPGVKEEVTLDQIRASAQYQELISLGAIDDTSERIWSNGNFRTRYPFLENLKITIYSSGPIRAEKLDRPYIITSSPGFKIINMEGWKKKMDWVKKYLMKKIAREQLGVKSIKKQEELANLSIGEYYTELLNMKGDVFIEWLLSQEKNFIELILNTNIDLKTYIEKDPARASITLKKIYKHPYIKKTIDSMNRELAKDFERDITLVGNLSDLGF